MPALFTRCIGRGGSLWLLDVPVEPGHLFRQNVQDRLTRPVAVALVREHHEPDRPAVTLHGVVEPLGLDREVPELLSAAPWMSSSGSLI